MTGTACSAKKACITLAEHDHIVPSPVVIAVSGHRALHADDCARAGAQLAEALAEIAQALTDAPLHCLSPLAAGADQLFAEQVLALQERLGVARV
jgi:hypothetical protein